MSIAAVNAQNNLKKKIEEAKDTIKYSTKAYEEDIEKQKTYWQNLIIEEQQGRNRQNRIDYYSGRQQYAEFNSKMKNLFVASEISSFFNNSADVSLQRYFANYNSTNKTINLGVNFDGKNRGELDKLNAIFTFGAILKTSESFGTIFKDGDFEKDNLALTFKYSNFSSGFVSFEGWRRHNGTRKERVEIVKANRNRLKNNYDTKNTTFIKSQFSDDIKSLEILHDYDENELIKHIDEYAKNKSKDVYEEIAKEEVAYLKKNKLYKSFQTSWYSFDIVIPAGSESILTSDSENNTATVENRFWALKTSASLGYLIKYSNAASFYISPKFSFQNNNNINSTNSNAKEFQTFITQSNNERVVTGSKQVHIIEYDEFYTPSLSLEIASLFLGKGFAGLSLNLEKNFGKYDDFNWKIGVPLSIKDNNGKPSINIEVQYRQINSIRELGFSTSILLGKLIN
ncbi:hypothetical protein GCM10011368_13030 [Hyunsoonleella pacifica]|nr:hypothetical protein GCM10011368_13030 [Hyunsoonleella pacifica]